MIILGIDPGIATMGYGILDVNQGKNKIIDYGVILTPKNEGLPVRLAMIEEGINKIFDKFNPMEVAMEELFYFKNAKTIIPVAEARGVILLTCIKRCGKLFEYTPLQIKQGLTGYGRADKNQIQQMVKTLLNLKEIPKPDDAADAVAVALLHSQTKNFTSLFSI